MKTKDKKQNRYNRKRNNQVNFYMSDEELAKLEALVKTSGMTKQNFLINATLGAAIASADSVKDLPDLMMHLLELLNQFKGIGVNCNQMARIANTYKAPPTEQDLRSLYEDVAAYGKEVSETCHLLKPLIRELHLKQP